MYVKGWVLGGAQCNNQTDLGRDGGRVGGTKVSGNLSVLFARVPSLCSCYTPFLCLLSESSYGQRIMAAGLYISQGRRSKIEVYFFLFVFTLA